MLNNMDIAGSCRTNTINGNAVAKNNKPAKANAIFRPTSRFIYAFLQLCHPRSGLFGNNLHPCAGIIRHSLNENEPVGERLEP
jgi:hypothetical protein